MWMWLGGVWCINASDFVSSYEVVRGTPDHMLDHLISQDIDITQEGSFAYDFFLTHPAFIKMADLCSKLMAKYHQKEEGVDKVCVFFPGVKGVW